MRTDSSDWQFDPQTKHADLEITNNGFGLRLKQGTSWQTCISKKTVSQGKHSFEAVCIDYGNDSNSYKILVGLAGAGFTATYLGGSQHSWAYIFKSGETYHNNIQTSKASLVKLYVLISLL